MVNLDRRVRTAGERLHFLLATAETHPTHRSDVRVLFGKYLRRLGIETDLVAACAAGELPTPWGGGRLLSLRYGSRVGLILADLLLQLSLFKRCFHGYDGVVVRDKPFLGAIGLAAARLSGIRFVYWMSFPMPEADLAIARAAGPGARWPRRLHTWLRGMAGSFVLHRFLVPAADHLFVQSPVMLEELRARGLHHDRVTPVPMGVDIETLPMPGAGGDAANLPRATPSAVYLGTLSVLRRRELQMMVDAAKLVSASRPHFVLLVIGEADTEEDRGWLRRYVEVRGAAGCVRFLGWLPYEKALAIARTCDMGLSPFPRGELFESASPTKAVEYMAVGLPVVCNDQPDQAQVVRESGGGLCVELSPEAFASAIVELCDDTLLARAMGRAGQAWVAENRNYRRLAETVASRLSSLVHANGQPRSGRRAETNLHRCEAPMQEENTPQGPAP